MTDVDIAQHWPDVSFTPTETRLLGYLVARGGEPVTESELLQEVWGYAPSARTRTVPTTVRRLRRKIETDPRRPRQLLFLRGQGYCLVPPEAPPLTRAEVERRLREWLGPDQDWVTLVAPAPGERGHIPSQSGPMFGRRDVLDTLVEGVRGGQRLLTVHGAAGLGKTTLALALARSLRDHFAGGAWFCPVEEALDAPDLLDAIAVSLGITTPPGAERSRAEQLQQTLRHLGPVLLVLDNFEQLPDDASRALAELLARVPDLQIVITSRRVLGLPGEATHSLAPLSRDEGVALLEHCLERAGLPAEEDQELLGRIVDLVEGVPLAIEMAASRARLLALPELHTRLDRDLGLLAHAAGGRPDRQKTLDEAIAWSWRLLSEPERESLAALGVFRGGFTLEAAERILDVEDGLDRLASLVDHSMIRRMPGGRLALFESVRQFVARQSPASASLRGRHADWALEHARRAESLGRGAQVALLATESDNLLVAHDFLLETSDPRAIDVLDAMVCVHAKRAVPRSLVERSRRTRAAIETTAEQGAHLNAILASVLCAEREFGEAGVEVERGLERVRPGSEDHVRLLASAAFLAYQRGESEVTLELAEQASTHAERLGVAHLQCQARMLRGASFHQRGQAEAAERAFEHASALAARSGSPGQEAQALANRASARLIHGGREEALAMLQVARERAIEAKDPSVLYSIDVALAVAYLLHKRYAEADALYTELLSLYPLHGAVGVAGVLHLNAGLAALYLDDAARAAGRLARARAELVGSGRSGVTRVMTDAYYAVALAESGEGAAALPIWSELVAPEADALWPLAPGEFALCRAHRHLVCWRQDGASAHLDAAREALSAWRATCSDTAACIVLQRALDRAG